MPWHARLALDYSAEQQRSVARFRHDGPLRILQSLYPEGDAICHNVLVHPPGGLVGGDTLDIAITGAAGSHGLITTPGATRFYRSEGEAAVQAVHGPALDAAKRAGESATAAVTSAVDEMREDYEHQLDARYAAARGFVDAIIHPEDTRAVLETALRASLNNPGAHLGPFVLPGSITCAPAVTSPATTF